MANSAPIRFGAIGCGGAGTDRIRQLAAHELGLKVVAAVDINPPRLDNLAKVIGYDDFVRYTGPEDYKKLIDENELDAVGIFTPHIPHYDHVKYALQKGKHVIIEKPMVCGAKNALEITRLCDKQKKVGIIHYQRHYELKYIKAREMIQKGVLGKITNFFVYMAQDWSGSNWRGMPEFSGGGQINDSGSHYQDIILWMLGELPVAAEGFIDNYYHTRKLDVEANGMFHVELTNNICGRMIILSDIPGGFVDDVRIVGEKGTITFRGDSLIHYDKAENKYYEEALARPKAYPVSPCDNFVKLLKKKGTKNQVPFIFGTRVALLTEALLISARLGGKKVYCEDILKACGHTLDDLAY
jgi:predicted dehydrogenase